MLIGNEIHTVDFCNMARFSIWSRCPTLYPILPTLTNFIGWFHIWLHENPQNQNRGRPDGQAPIPWNIYGILRFSVGSHYRDFMVECSALKSTTSCAICCLLQRFVLRSYPDRRWCIFSQGWQLTQY